MGENSVRRPALYSRGHGDVKGLTDQSGNAEPDHDGIPNLLECAFALEPLAANGSGLPSAARDQGHLTFTYRQNMHATDITFSVQSSSALDGTV